MNKTEDKINELIKIYRHSPEHLSVMIEEKRGKIKNDERMKFEQRLIQYDLKILEKALEEIKLLALEELVVKIIPIVISLYFVVFEASHIKQSVANIEDIYSFAVVYIKSVIIFFVFPIAYIEKIINYFLRIETVFLPVNFFYKIMYWATGILLVIKLFESIG